MNQIAMNYEKISDDLFMFGNNLILRFNVQLAKKNMDGGRQCYQSEYQYPSEKYNDVRSLVTVRRSFDYYLSIENIKKSEDFERTYIPIYTQDFIQFRDKIIESIKWFQDEKYKNIFAKDGEKIVLIENVEPIIYSSLVSNTSIKIEPIPFLNKCNEYKLGVRISFNTIDIYSEIEIDRYMGLVYIISSLNMYQSAQIILNYMQPCVDTHRVSMSSDDDRFIQQKQKAVSFFDK